ncbi:NADP-dependent oxidoreductase [Leifsonia kafniensis]
MADQDVSQAVGVSQFGGPEVLEIFDHPVPVPSPDEALIEVTAATVNPTDVLLRSGAQAEMLRHSSPPYIPGMEVSGVVTTLGRPSNRLAVGEMVIAIVDPIGPRGGAQARHICVPVDSVVRAPRGLDYFSAATIPMNGLTAMLALDYGALEPGSTLLVTGAVGAVGGYVVQLATAAGIRVIADASPADEQLVRDLGADVIAPRGAGFIASVRAAAPEGVDAIVDGATLGAAIDSLLMDDGIHVYLRAWGDSEANTDRIRRRRVAVREHVRDTERLLELVTSAEEGALTPRVSQILPMRRAAEAHRLIEGGGQRGRLVLDMKSEAGGD